ncbi:MAG TPA: VOC family protein [Actinoplanes sp.]|jgi:predicted enzyme related to lactoylglutathione lyase|nr:VOC family protein [Actinoplanes sp.]
MSAVNGIGWFEIATDEPAVAERFYADVFGWTYGNDRGEATGADDMAYRMVMPPGAERPAGGIFPTGGKAPNYAIFYVLVTDPAETCRAAEAAGGKVLLAPKTTPDGLSFAHLLDPSGNHFGVFTPPPAGE